MSLLTSTAGGLTIVLPSFLERMISEGKTCARTLAVIYDTRSILNNYMSP